MKKKILLGMSMLVVSGTLVACNVETEKENKKPEVENQQKVSEPEENKITENTDKKVSAEENYQNILDDYSIKIKDATPKLIEEYKAEAKSNQEGLNGLAELSVKKVESLATISTEGVQKMAEVMMNTGSGKYEDYEAWAGKLMDVYTDESQKIMDVYLESATK